MADSLRYTRPLGEYPTVSCKVFGCQNSNEPLILHSLTPKATSENGQDGPNTFDNLSFEVIDVAVCDCFVVAAGKR